MLCNTFLKGLHSWFDPVWYIYIYKYICARIYIYIYIFSFMNRKESWKSLALLFLFKVWVFGKLLDLFLFLFLNVSRFCILITWTILYANLFQFFGESLNILAYSKIHKGTVTSCTHNLSWTLLFGNSPSSFSCSPYQSRRINWASKNSRKRRVD